MRPRVESYVRQIARDRMACPGSAHLVASMRTRWLGPVAVAIAAAALLPSWARAAPIWPAAGEVEEHQQFGAPVAGFGGWLLWSRYDAKRRVYRLVGLHEGRVRTLAIRSRSVPFDVDLGPDARGRTVAVYSRCREEPVTGPPVGPFPFYRTGRGCRLYEYRFSSARERRLGSRFRAAAHCSCRRSGASAWFSR